jgi:hypothetical protein
MILSSGVLVCIADGFLSISAIGSFLQGVQSKK